MFKRVGIGIGIGVFGGHRYYLGDTGQAIAMTLTLGGLGLWWLYDAFCLSADLRFKAQAVGHEVLLEIEDARLRYPPLPISRPSPQTGRL